MSDEPRSVTRTYAGYLGIRLLLFAVALGDLHRCSA